MKRKVQAHLIILFCVMFISIINLKAQNRNVSGKLIADDGLPLPLASVTLQDAKSPNYINFHESPPADTVVRGRVTNEKNQPVALASVQVKGSPVGTTTNAQGEFSLKDVNDNATLVISAVGYVTLEIALNGRNELSLQLVSNVTGLEEVVVTALGISRKTKSLSYATQSLKPSQFTEVRDPNNILNSLQGKVANALITQSSGGVGSEARIILRGNRSINNNSSALIVIDGIPGGDPGINPDNIESMTILTGAAGAALYGSEAGNGVIVITTKKGRKDGITVSINSGITAERPFALPKVQNIYGQGGDGTINSSIGDSWGAKMTGQSYTDQFGNQSSYTAQPDNIKDFFRTGIAVNNAISVSAGSEKAQTYLSYVNNSVQGIIPNNKLTSNIVNFRITNQISNRFSTDAKITYHRREIKGSPRIGEGNTPSLDIYQIPRNVSTQMAEHFQDINSLGVPVLAPWPSTKPGVYANPYWEVNNDQLDKIRTNIIGFLKAKFKFTDWLSIVGSANIDGFSEKQEQKTFQGTIAWAPNPGGYYQVTNTDYLQKWFDVILEGENNITKDLVINYHAGAIYKDNKIDNTIGTADGLNVTNKFSLNLATTPITTQTGSEIQVQSVFGLANLSFKDYLFLEGTFRNDWDSRLPAPHTYPYYSFGLSGILSDMINLPSGINFLKANISYAEVGNGGQFGLLSTPYDYVPGVGNGYLIRRSTLPFPTLKPEIVRSLEVGAEARFLNNKFSVSLNYYKTNSFNQLFQLSIPVGSGYSTSYLNAGNIQNKGIEVIINASPVKTKDLGWSIAFNFGMNRNKVIELTEQVKTINLGFIDFGALPQIKEGGSFGDLVSHVWQKNEKGQYQVTTDGKPLTSDKLGLLPSYIGNFNPKARLGLTNTINYKDFSLRVLVDGRIGGIIVSGTEMNLSFSGISEATTQHREGGLVLGGVDGSGNPVSVPINAQQFWQTASGKRFGVGDFYAYDATNFRVRELSLGYDLPLHSPFIKSARLSLIARNLFWLYRGSSKLDVPGLSKRKMWMDPDMSLYNGNGLMGVEYGALPSTRSIGLNLQLTF
ncbi:MAG: SusC/RagA family TonB-linked outer membrane protein [Ferruginibacter sp.]